MQVILQEDVAKLGKAGDVVNVKEGFGRNYLLPKKKAVPADLGNLKQMEHHKREVAAKQLKVKKAAQELAKKFSSLSIIIARESGEGDKLFGSVTSKDIADALRAEGHFVDRHALILPEPIKALGVFEVQIKLHSDVTATVKVSVAKKS